MSGHSPALIDCAVADNRRQRSPDHPLALEQQLLSKVAQYQTQWRRGQGDDSGPAQRLIECPAKAALVTGCGAAPLSGPARSGAAIRVHDEAHEIVAMNSVHPIPARTERGRQVKLKGGEETRQHGDT